VPLSQSMRLATLAVVASLLAASAPALAQRPAKATETHKVSPPTPRLADGTVDLGGHGRERRSAFRA